MERNREITGLDKPLRYVIYARKSTEGTERQARSIKDQISDCKALAERKGLTVVDEPIEERKSAKIANQRPAFKSIIKRLRAGDIDGIITWHPDRLARNMRDASLVMDLLEHEKMKGLEFCTYAFDNSPAGRLSLNILFAVATHYSDDLAQKTRRGIRKKFLEGGLGGYHKYGYVQEGGYYYPDTHNHNFAIVQMAWKMRAEGKTYEEIIAFLAKNNYTERQKDGHYEPRLFNKPALTRMFNDSFYFGVAVQADQTVDLKQVIPDFVPMVDERTFAIVQERNRAATRGDNKRKTHFLPYRELVYCATCHDKRPMTVYRARSGRGVYYIYFKCKNPNCPRRPKDIRCKKFYLSMKDLLEAIAKRLSSDAYETYLREMVSLSSAQKKALRNANTGLLAQNKWLEEQCAKDAEKLVAVEDVRMKDVIQRTLIGRRNQIDENTVRIKENEEKLNRTVKQHLSKEYFNLLVCNLSENYSKGTFVQQDLIVREIFSNLEFDGKKITNAICKEPFASILGTRIVPCGGSDETRTRDLCRDRAAL